jgi:hypothetical protein
VTVWSKTYIVLIKYIGDIVQVEQVSTLRELQASRKICNVLTVAQCGTAIRFYPAVSSGKFNAVATLSK